MSELVLSNNMISSISGEPFKKQQKVRLDNNRLTSAAPMLNLVHLKYLDISSNQLATLPRMDTSNSRLQQLIANHNQIVEIDEDDLNGMSSLIILDLSNNNITQISSNAFNNCVSLYQLSLANNHVVQLPNLRSQNNLVELSISNNIIEALPEDLCETCPLLGVLSAEYNRIKSVPNLRECRRLNEVLLEKNVLTSLNVATFQGLSQLRTIDLSYNAINSLTYGLFQGLNNLKYLYLDHNIISHLPTGIFEDLVNLIRVDLNHNHIQSLPDNLFQRNIIISDIRLNNNKIVTISPTAFENNSVYLQRLNLSSNMFSEWIFPRGGFPSLLSLSVVNVEQLYDAPDPFQCACPGIQQLELTYPYHCCLWEESFDLEYLTTLQSENVTLPIENPTFPPMRTVIPPFNPGDGSDLEQLLPILDWFAAAYGLVYRILPGPIIIWEYSNNTQLYTDVTPSPPTVIMSHSLAPSCYPRANALTPCDNLLKPWPLRSVIWTVIVLVLLGNGTVLLVMFASKDFIKVPQFFILNLAFADFCLGIYLTFLASFDATTYSKYIFYQSALKWQKGPGCMSAGFIAVFSSALSCCMLIAIILERVYTVYRSPKPGMSISMAVIIAIFSWLISSTFAALPLVGINSYSKVAWCLPFVTSDFKDKVYIGVLLAMIMAAFLIILVSYVIILFPALCCSTALGQCRSETVKQLLNMAPIVIIDFLCRLPIVVIGYSAVFNQPIIDASQIKWLVVLVYPFSAFTNPLWYAIITKGFLCHIWSMLKHIMSSLKKLPAHIRSRSTAQNNKFAKYEELETPLTQSSDSGQLCKSLFIFKEMPQKGDSDTKNRSTLPIHSDGCDQTCCTHIQVTPNQMGYCGCNVSSNVANSPQNPSEDVPGTTTMNYTLDSNPRLFGKESEV